MILEQLRIADIQGDQLRTARRAVSEPTGLSTILGGPLVRPGLAGCQGRGQRATVGASPGAPNVHTLAPGGVWHWLVIVR